jgi:hypothetical protein
MDAHEIEVGQHVRVSWLHRIGRVMEIDREYYAARVVLLSDEAEHWVRIDDLEPPVPRQRSHYHRTSPGVLPSGNRSGNVDPGAITNGSEGDSTEAVCRTR